MLSEPFLFNHFSAVWLITSKSLYLSVILPFFNISPVLGFPYILFLNLKRAHGHIVGRLLARINLLYSYSNGVAMGLLYSWTFIFCCYNILFIYFIYFIYDCFLRQQLRIMAVCMFLLGLRGLYWPFLLFWYADTSIYICKYLYSSFFTPELTFPSSPSSRYK